jgi:hypothetical protein
MVTIWKIENTEVVSLEAEEVGEFEGFPLLRYHEINTRTLASRGQYICFDHPPSSSDRYFEREDDAWDVLRCWLRFREKIAEVEGDIVAERQQRSLKAREDF